MEQLIWFSMPGAFIVIAIAIVCPSIVGTTGAAALSIASIPAIGFSVHQLSRLIFEVRGGFKGDSRTVLHAIANNIGPEEADKKMNREKAFLVWEITFYGEKFPEVFRDHDRRTWHYILSFWGIATASVICCLIFVFGVVYQQNTVSFDIFSPPNLLAFLIYFSAIIIFYFKGKTTQKSLYEQEEAIFHHQKSLFDDTYKEIGELQKPSR